MIIYYDKEVSKGQQKTYIIFISFIWDLKISRVGALLVLSGSLFQSLIELGKNEWRCEFKF